jgi:drug/metabolite transporter (DMT)-like permease
VLIAFIWGSSFVVVKAALNHAAPLPWLIARFSLAGLLLLGTLARGRLDRRSLRPGLVLGIFLFGGFAFQTFGQKYTTPSKCAFITGFSVILVPIIMAFRGQVMRFPNYASAALGLAGIYFLVRPARLEAINRGDIYTLWASVCYAGHIVLVGHYSRRYSFRHLVPLQIMGVALLAIAVLPLDRDHHVHWEPALLAALSYTALLSTGFAFSVQNWAQQYTPPAHTALIFALEPVFAALASLVFTGERLGGKLLLGSVLILGGMLMSELWGRPMPASMEG